MLEVSNISLALAGAEVLSDASLSVKPGELVAILGPNGAGKTSLLRCAAGLARPYRGQCLLEGNPLGGLSHTARARQIGYLPQKRPLAWPNCVRDVVALGRFAYGAAMGRLGPDDQAAVDDALAKCDLAGLAQRPCDQLSGGELARVHVARALAGQTAFLLADEPTAALDPRHQLRVMDLLSGYVKQGGGALLVIHDIDLALRYADRFIWMREGRITAQDDGIPSNLAHRIHDTFRVEAQVVTVGGRTITTLSL